MSAALLALITVLVAGFILRAPIGFSMIVSGVAFLGVKGQDIGLAADQIMNGLYNSYVLLAVPLFILAANLMNAGTSTSAACWSAACRADWRRSTSWSAWCFPA